MSLDALTKQLGIYSGTISIEEQEINIELNIESDEDGVPLDTTASPEAEMLDAGEEEAALDETADAQEDLEEAHDALEALAISIEKYRLSGGMSPAIAEEKYKQMDLITRKWGSLRSSVPSVESFGLESSQMAATISLENAAWEAVKKFWQTIVETVTKWITSFRDWIVKIFNVGTKLKKRNDALLKLVNDDMKNPNPTDNFKGHIAQGVYVEKGKISEAAENVYQLAIVGLDKSVKKYDQFNNSLMSGSLKAVLASIDSGNKDNGIDVSGIYDALIPYSDLKLYGQRASRIPGVNMGLVTIPGAKAFGLNIVPKPAKFTLENGDLAKAKKWVNTVGAEVVTVIPKDKLKDVSVKAASKEECITICNTVTGIAKYIEAYKTNYQIREKAGKQITEAAKTFIKDTKEENAKSVELAKANTQIAQLLYSRVTAMDKVILNASISSVNALLNYVTASVNAGKSEKKEEKKTDDKK